MIANLFRSGERGSRRHARLVRRTSEIIVHLGEVLDELTKAERFSPEQAIALIDAIEGLERKLAVSASPQPRPARDDCSAVTPPGMRLGGTSRRSRLPSVP